MNETVSYYDQNAEAFIEGTLHADMSAARERFLQYVPAGGSLLDAGCGSGRDTLAFQQAGYQVDAFDASEEVCRISSKVLGFPVQCMRFEDLTGESKYDGIWACASLLHVAADDLEDVIHRLKKLLKPNGVLYASWKEGSGERVKDGRFFHDMTLEKCSELFEGAGLTVLESYRSQDVREGREGEAWVNVIGRKTELNWSVLGTGVIANEMASALQKMGRRLYSVANRTHEKAVSFAEKYQVEVVYDRIDDVFEDEKVDIIYITTPHNTHYEFMRKALEAGKHVFVEKSITLNSRELDEMVELADRKRLVIGEAMTIWHMPLYKRLWSIVESSRLGKVQMITVNFGSFKEYDMRNRFFNMDLAGGAMLDIGVYALSIVRSFMSEQPDQIVSQWKPSPTGSDEQGTVLLMNAQGEMASVALSMHSKQPKRAMISCEKGYIEIMEFPRADRAVIVDAATGEREEITAGASADALCYELLDMEEAVKSGNTAPLKLAYTKDVMDTMTRLRKDWGMKYPGEEW